MPQISIKGFTFWDQKYVFLTQIWNALEQQQNVKLTKKFIILMQNVFLLMY